MEGALFALDTVVVALLVYWAVRADVTRADAGRPDGPPAGLFAWPQPKASVPPPRRGRRPR